MSDKTRIQEILENLETACHLEDVCGGDSHLLEKVRGRWEQMQRVQRQVESLLPFHA